MPGPTRRTLDQRTQRVAAVLPLLMQRYPEARCSLDHADPLQLLVATILSAQCTDARVNVVTRDLFRACRTAGDFARMPQAELEKAIQSTGFFRNKAKAIRAMAQSLLDRHGGVVPRTMEELTSLAGVGRKTANVVLGNAFGIEAGVTVDTHVTRLSNRLGLTKHRSDAVKIERDLMACVPRERWTLWSHLLIHHGRAVCQARRPRCDVCPLLAHCPAGAKLTRDAERPKAARRGGARAGRGVSRAGRSGGL